MKQEAYERTLKARAFDISRYLLPLATNTSLGEIVNARTLETQVAHLLSHTHKEVRGLGESVEEGRDFAGLQRECGVVAGIGGADRGSVARTGGRGRSRNCCAKCGLRPR